MTTQALRLYESIRSEFKGLDRNTVKCIIEGRESRGDCLFPSIDGPQAARMAVVSYARHNFTNYDPLMKVNGYSKLEARTAIAKARGTE